MTRASEEDSQLVVCISCGAMRHERWTECFCHETDTRPAPQRRTKKDLEAIRKSNPEDRLFSDD